MRHPSDPTDAAEDPDVDPSPGGEATATSRPSADPAQILAGLPVSHADVLRGVAAGASDAELAEIAGVDVAAVPSFLRVAVAKLLDVGRVAPSGVAEVVDPDEENA